ncbi:hypothetical protein C8Q75DRAFT_432817 [Abortiporus biennis]|nr:hypothetical protein C8Q75DRAFT_432817 [Abortiporus biennis]
MTSPQDTLLAIRNSYHFFRDVCAKPRPDDIFEFQPWDMAGAHGVYAKTAFLVYKEATNIPQEKHISWVGLILQWTTSVKHHHHFEETVFFPMLGDKFNFEQIQTEHDLFVPGLQKLEDYLVSCLPSGSTYGIDGLVVPEHENTAEYDGQHVRELMDSFVVPMLSHLQAEIDYISSKNLREADVTVKHLEDLAKVLQKYIMSSPKTTAMVFHILMRPDNTSWPAAPGFLKDVLVPYVFAIPKRDLWQFIPKKLDI